MEDTKQVRKNLLMYPLGTVGRDMIYALFNNFLLTFVLFTRSLTAAQLAAITAIMVAARVFDGLNDPIMGNIIERTRTKWGKFKPWLLAGVLSSSVVVIAAFNCRLQGWPFVVFFGVVYFLYSITFTMNDISYWGMVPALSSDGNTRNQFTSRATLFAGIGSTLASIVIPMLTTGAMAIGGNTATAYGVIAIVICVLAPLFILFTLLGVQENRDDMAEPAPKVSFRLILKTITGNDQLMWASLVLLLQQIGNGIVVGGIGSTYIYFEFGYNGGLYSLFTTVGMSVTALLMIFYPALSRKFPRKRLMAMMQVIGLVGYALMLGPGLAMPSTMAKFYVITVGYLFANFGQYGFYLVMMISIINTVEYNEYKHGNRAEAIISSLRPFLTKLASALCVAITSATYLIFGVTRYTNQISDFENQAAMGAINETQKLSGITEMLKGIQGNQSTGLLLAMTLVPLAFMLASYFIYKAKYTLDEPEYDRICKEIQERKAK